MNMPPPPAGEPAERKPFRLWPGVLAVVLQWLGWSVLPRVAPEATIFGVAAGVLGGLVIVGWWLLFSRAPWLERVGVLTLMPAAVFLTRHVVHESVANGMMGWMLPVFAVPALSLALVCWAVTGRRLSRGPRRAALVGVVVMTCGVFALLRTGGVTGEGDSDLHWRWTPTPEDRLLALGESEPEPAALQPAGAKAGADWPGFRGPSRDGTVRGVRIATDWSRSPPVELWRRPVGPGWSSFAVSGDLLYTQEQRGDDEVVACYHLTTGRPVWKRRDAARFWESNGGAGPRATPTLSNGRVYTLGATGILNALDAGDGAVKWSRNAAIDTDTKNPGWGFAGSPLVINDIVVVAVSGRLAAYDVATGDPRWIGPAGGAGYSSPHLATIDGVAQVILQRGARTISVAPADGATLWEHSWQSGVSILQPARTADGDVLLAGGDATGGIGIRRIKVANGPARWTVEERWTSRGLKPYFSDFVVHKGHAFGFDGSLLACINLVDGNRTWKGERYGHGQLILLPDQDVLLVLSEWGELALIAAAPDECREVSRFPAIKGKTWNHPVLAGDILLVRNGQEMVAFRLSPAGR